MWWVKGSRLKTRQEWETHPHVPIPEGEGAGLKALRQHEPQRVEILAQVTEKRHLATPYHFMTKPEIHSQQGQKEQIVSSGAKIRKIHTEQEREWGWQRGRGNGRYPIPPSVDIRRLGASERMADYGHPALGLLIAPLEL